MPKELAAGGISPADPGVGVKNFRVTFVFGTEMAFQQFLDPGWSGSVQPDAVTNDEKADGVYMEETGIPSDFWVYQTAKNGLNLQLIIQGTKYSKDDDLNK
jgi:hypothetical protein